MTCTEEAAVGQELFHRFEAHPPQGQRRRSRIPKSVSPATDQSGPHSRLWQPPTGLTATFTGPLDQSALHALGP